ncbi:hypothetical protein SAMN03159422_02399 [Agrobacterium fabrum]|nr:hypothetical protein SAMN03159422_02399 [Agrobacterium fabrum]SER31192.1 hypothetical protein SAMN03159504_02651 [Agrobacterium fabrum]
MDVNDFGLFGERISGSFREPRPNRPPHRGMDVSSSMTHKNFTAGVFGQVIDPQGGPWGTITVRPFNEPSTIIQYLHCFDFKVGRGDLVAPWTIIGSTGDTAPPGTNITGIHLHVHLIQPGTPTDPGWSQNYVDPATWSRGTPGQGQWRQNAQGYEGTIKFTSERTLHIISFENPAPNFVIEGYDFYEFRWRNNDCRVRVDLKFTATFVGSSNNGLRFEIRPTQILKSGPCHSIFRANVPELDRALLVLRSENTMLGGDGLSMVEFKKISPSFNAEYPAVIREDPFAAAATEFDGITITSRFFAAPDLEAIAKLAVYDRESCLGHVHANDFDCGCG